MTLAHDHRRTARPDTRALRAAAREAARQARATGNAEVARLVADVEDLVHELGAAVDPGLTQVRGRVEDSLTGVRARLTRGAGEVGRRAGEVGRRAGAALARGDRYVHGQPWPAIGAAAVVGLVVGVLLLRR